MKICFNPMHFCFDGQAKLLGMNFKMESLAKYIKLESQFRNVFYVFFNVKLNILMWMLSN